MMQRRVELPESNELKRLWTDCPDDVFGHLQPCEMLMRTSKMSESNPVHNGWGDREVVITGVGMVTPIGVSTMETWRALCLGDNGIGPITRVWVNTFPVRFAAECRDIEVIGHEGFSSMGQRIVATQREGSHLPLHRKHG